MSEWNMRKGATDAFQDAASYAPRVDVAIGPFNLSFQNQERDAERIRTFDHPLVEQLKQVVWRQNHGGVPSASLLPGSHVLILIYRISETNPPTVQWYGLDQARTVATYNLDAPWWAVDQEIRRLMG